jgi:dTDP-4-amino-4,6-dideoxygalactose transaminase
VPVQKIPLVDVKAQYAPLIPELQQRFAQVLEDGQFVLGPNVKAFEEEAAAYLGVPATVGVANGTDALVLVLDAMEIGAGDEVICPSFTFYATAEAIARRGAIPVFAEIDPATYNLDPEDVDRRISARTKAIMPVHLYGRCADMDAIGEIARRNGAVVIEDAAQAAGSTYKGRPAGSLGDIACFSFYPAKNLGAIGEGGAVVTDNPEHAERIRTLRDHGSKEKYTHELLGYNYRMEAVQGAALRVKLKRLAAWNEARRAVAAQFRRAVSGVELLADAEDGMQNYHIFPVLSDRRDALRSHLANHGIETGIHYPVPAHRQPVYLDLGLTTTKLPVTEMVCGRVLSLPMHPYLTASEVETVAQRIGEFAG